MLSKIMSVYFGNDALPYKDIDRQTHFPIVGNVIVGENNITNIRFFVDRIGGTNSASWIANIKKPNGTVFYRLLTTKGSSQNENYVELNIADLYTDFKGDLMISLSGYSGNNIQISDDEEEITITGNSVVATTGIIKVGVNYAVQSLPKGQFDPAIEQLILAILQNAVLKQNSIDVVDNIATMSLVGYEEGQVVYDRATKTIYKIEEEEGSLTYVFYSSLGDVLYENHNALQINALLQNRAYIGNFDNLGASLYFKVNGKLVCIHTNGVHIFNNDGTLYKKSVISENGNVVDNHFYKGSIAEGNELVTKSQLDTKQKNLIAGAKIILQSDGTISVDTSDIAVSVNGQQGVIVLHASDIYASNMQTIQQNLERIDELIDGLGEDKEDKSNKSTSLTASSTDTQYPSAKGVYDFVNSSINNLAAFYITKDSLGNAFNSYAELENATTFYSGGSVRTPSKNDYCIVRTDENHDNATTRYIYQGTQWEFQYVVNEEPLTQAQLNALNSGVTALKVASYDQALLDMVKQADFIVSGGVITAVRINNVVRPVAENLDWHFTPKIVETYQDLPQANDNFLYLVLEDMHIYYYEDGWQQGGEYNVAYASQSDFEQLRDSIKHPLVITTSSTMLTSTIPAISVPALTTQNVSDIETAIDNGRLCVIKTPTETLIVHSKDTLNSEHAIQLWYYGALITYEKGGSVVATYEKFVPTTRTIAGISLANDISADTLLNALVNTSDYVFNDWEDLPNE